VRAMDRLFIMCVLFAQAQLAEQEITRASWLALNETERVLHYLDLAPRLGIQCPKVGISTFYYPTLGKQLRGAIALADIMPMEEICVIPETRMISFLTLANTSLEPLTRVSVKGNPLQGHILEEWEAMAMSLFILREGSRSSSPFAPYILALFNGHDPDSIPKTWSQNSSRFAALNYDLQAMVRKWQLKVSVVYQHIAVHVIQKYTTQLSEGGVCGPSTTSCLEFYSLERVIKVLAVVQARDWALPMHGVYRQFLAPLIDLLNFGQVGIRVHFNDKRRAFIAIAHKGVKSGSELLFYYGQFCRDQSMLIYGFIPEGSRPCRRASLNRPRRNNGKAATLSS